MNDDTRVSIALTTYNGEQYLPQLLDSISCQTLLPIEIVAFDDRSSDNTLTKLNEFKNRLPLTVYVNEHSVGVVKNFRQAVAMCRGEYIAFCDQDDVWLPEKLSWSIEALKKIDGPWPAMVFTDLCVVDKSLHKVADSYWKHRKLQPSKESFASLIYGNIVTGCTMIINRAMAVEVSRMPDDVLMHDFWIACVAYGIGRCSFVELPTILYRQHGSNVTNNDAVTWRTRWKRLHDFLSTHQQAAQFLHPEIKQARSYMGLYEQRLSASKLQALKELIALERRSPLVRKWRTFLTKYLHIIRKY